MDVVTRISESPQAAANVDAVIDGIDGSGADDVDGVALADTDVDGPIGTSGAAELGDADVAAVDDGLGPPLRGWPALDALFPHAYTISKITRSNPPSTIARRRQ